MKGIVSRTRLEWVKNVLGARRSLTAKNVQRAFNWRQREGWISAMEADGPAYERVAMVRETHPIAPIIRQYGLGTRWFDRASVEAAIAALVSTRMGAGRLAKAGFAIRQANGSQIELAATDPKEALYINEARCCPQIRGHGYRGVIESVLHVRRPGTRRINVDDARRIQAHDVLMKKWGIRCDDLLQERKRVRLFSSWTFRQAAAA